MLSERVCAKGALCLKDIPHGHCIILQLDSHLKTFYGFPSLPNDESSFRGRDHNLLDSHSWAVVVVERRSRTSFLNYVCQEPLCSPDRR